MLQKLLSSGQMTLYERQYTYELLKQVGMPVIRDRMLQILKFLDPGGVASQHLQFTTRPRGAYLVPGPNFVRSIDCHHKLTMYGIEIYAGIDAFSRHGWYIPWIYVCISTRTEVSYLYTGVLPHAIRSDCGTETMMMASTPWPLYQALCPDI
ncbi:hypothetical protein B9Z19DRAFT_993694 [Tuber borchii]|uniref:Uncharacterized protein n=1 Tax=Tuber borchii TaxID=42251 RepID=A0A2T6ZJM1_TUBBO|nr:hypothetical protein B9Z19DRAFT_993694 [Tuber borchii]